MPADDMTKGEHVDGEEGRTEHGALGDPTGVWGRDFAPPRATCSVLSMR